MKALVGCEADLDLPGGVDGVARNCVDMICLAPGCVDDVGVQKARRCDVWYSTCMQRSGVKCYTVLKGAQYARCRFADRQIDR